MSDFKITFYRTQAFSEMSGITLYRQLITTQSNLSSKYVYFLTDYKGFILYGLTHGQFEKDNSAVWHGSLYQPRRMIWNPHGVSSKNNIEKKKGVGQRTMALFLLCSK